MTEELSQDGGTTEGTPSQGERSEATPERAVDVQNSGNEFDINSVPEAVRPHVEKLLKESEGARERVLQATREAADHRKQLEAYSRNEKIVAQQMRDLFNDPNPNVEKFKALRTAYAPMLGLDISTEAKVQKELETVEDILKEAEKRAEAKADEKIRAAQSHQESRALWHEALNEVGKDPVFKRYERVITNLALHDPEYNKMYWEKHAGKPTEYLKTILEDHKKLIAQEREDIKVDTLNAVKGKMTNSTQKPMAGKTASQGKASREDIIAEWRAMNR